MHKQTQLPVMHRGHLKVYDILVVELKEKVPRVKSELEKAGEERQWTLEDLKIYAREYFEKASIKDFTKSEYKEFIKIVTTRTFPEAMGDLQDDGKAPVI